MPSIPTSTSSTASSLYAARCVTCHGAQGDAIGGVNLRSGKFRNAQSDNDLARFIRAGSQAAGMPPFALDNAEMAGVIAYLRNMNTFDTATVKAGDVARGRAVFDGKGGCAACHRIGRVGSRVAPNLSDIGSQRSPGSLQRSLLDPSSQMMPINRPVRLVKKDGTVINGRRLNEDTYSIQVVDDKERLHSILKADLARVHDLEDVADAVLQGHAQLGRNRRPARLPAVVERAVAMMIEIDVLRRLLCCRL